MTEPAGNVSLAEATRVWAKIALLGFGGPAGQIALMHRILVEERKWIGEARFLHALNYCMLLPGPEAQQLACYAGWLLRGQLGGVIAGALFVLPGALAMWLLCCAYVHWHGSAVVEALGYGLKAAVIAVVAAALVRVARRALTSRWRWLLAAAAFVALALLALPFPVVIALAAAFGALVPMSAVERPPALPAAPGERRRLARRTAATAAVWLALWLAPLAVLAWTLGPEHVLSAQSWFFSRAAIVTFGGAYAVLPYVADHAVAAAWLTPSEMVDGLGLAETTPGPLVLVLEFVGFLGAARHAGWTPLLAGSAGAAVACWATFMPSYLWIFAGAPWIERTRGMPRLANALGGVTAAVVGVIAHLAWWFALHVLFARHDVLAVGALTIEVPAWSTFDPYAAAIALAAGAALIRWRVALGWVLAASVAAGATIWWLTGTG